MIDLVKLIVDAAEVVLHRIDLVLRCLQSNVSLFNMWRNTWRSLMRLHACKPEEKWKLCAWHSSLRTISAPSRNGYGSTAWSKPSHIVQKYSMVHVFGLSSLIVANTIDCLNNLEYFSKTWQASFLIFANLENNSEKLFTSKIKYCNCWQISSNFRKMWF